MWKSTVKDDGGRNVEWNEEFEIVVNDEESFIWFDCMEKDVFSSQMHGWGKINIKETATEENHINKTECWTEIYLKNNKEQPRGRVSFKFEWLPNEDCTQNGAPCPGFHF